MKKAKYKTIVDKNGNEIRYRVWVEYFKDEDSGRLIPIERMRPIKVNGEKVVWYSNSELKKMSKSERKSIEIKLKNKPSFRVSAPIKSN